MWLLPSIFDIAETLFVNFGDSGKRADIFGILLGNLQKILNRFAIFLTCFQEILNIPMGQFHALRESLVPFS